MFPSGADRRGHGRDREALRSSQTPGPRARALSDQIGSIDRSHFAPWLERIAFDLFSVDQIHVVGGSRLSDFDRPRSGLSALRMAMSAVGKDARATPRSNWTRPSVGQIGSPGSLRHPPDGPASRFAPRLPGQAELPPSNWSNLVGVCSKLRRSKREAPAQHRRFPARPRDRRGSRGSVFSPSP